MQPHATAKKVQPHRRWWRVGCAVVLGVACARGADQAPSSDEVETPAGLEDLLETGRQLWEKHAPEEVKAQYEFPSPESVEEFLAALERALVEGTFEELGAYEGDARRAFAVLRQFQGGDELADWLEPRLDFLTAANDEGTSAPLPGTVVRPPPARATERPALTRPYWDRIVVSRHAPARADELVPGLKQIFVDEGVPPAWVWIAEVESSMNPKARSPAGARGLFQFMPATAERFGLRVAWPDERTDPDKSARAAAAYLRFLHGKFGSWSLAIAAYNAGEGRVGRALESSGAHNFSAVARHLPAETRLYVPKVMATVAARESVDPETLPAPTPVDGEPRTR